MATKKSTSTNLPKASRNEQLALKNARRALAALEKANKMLLIENDDEQKFLNSICKIIAESRGYMLSWVGYGQNDENKTVKVVAQAGFSPHYLKEIKVSWGDNKWGRGPTGVAIKTGKIRVVQHSMTNPEYKPWRKLGQKYGFNASCSIPLNIHKEHAAIMIYSADPDAFHKEEVKVLKQLANNISFGINSIRTRIKLGKVIEKVNKVLVQTLEVASIAVEKRDPYTAGHQNRTASLANAIAKKMNLSKKQIEGITYGAMVHDIGKIYVPAEILNRPGKLTDLEMSFIKTHCQAGYDLIKDIVYPWPIAKIILQHHERLDGSGYPFGLKGHQIILEAKVVAVADVVEAMITHRPYRAACTLQEALEEISSKKGILYDPTAVDACINLFKTKQFRFELRKNLKN